MSAKKSETKVSAFETDTSRLIDGDDDDAHFDSSRSVWGKRDPGCLGGYNDVVSRLPSFQIFMFVAISAAVMTVLWGTTSTQAEKKELMSAFIGSAAVETMLSLDNLVVFHQIFGTFKVPPSRRPGILVAGLPIMLVVRVTLFLSFHGVYPDLEDKGCLSYIEHSHYLVQQIWYTT